jgi:hypothetical protein
MKNKEVLVLMHPNNYFIHEFTLHCSCGIMNDEIDKHVLLKKEYITNKCK